MIFLVAAVLVLVAAGGAVVLAVASGGADDRDGRFPLATAAAVVGGAVLVVGLAAVVLTVGIGRGSGSDGGGDEALAPPPTTAATTARVQGRAVERREVVGSPASFAVTVHVDARRGELEPPFVVDGVGDGDLVLVAARGFVPLAHGRVAQCDGYAARRCENVIDVQTDDAGGFDLPYRVTDAGDVLVVDVLDRRTGATFTRPPAAALEVGRDLEDRPLAVAVTAPTTAVRLSLLACPFAGAGLADCSLASAVSGSGSVSVPPDARTGDDVLVLVDGAGTPITTVRTSRSIAAVRSPGPDLDGTRLAMALLVAVGLVVAAVAVGRRTDWRAPAELSTGD